MVSGKRKALWNIFGFENLKKIGVEPIKMFFEQKFMIMKWRYAYKTNSSEIVSMMSIKNVGEFANTRKIHYRSKDEVRKPGVIVDYNSNMGGIDTLIRVIILYNIQREG